MNKIKIKINYHQLQQLSTVVDAVVKQILTHHATKQMNIQTKVSLDIYLGVRKYLKVSLAKKEELNTTNNKFKLSFRLFEAVQILQLMTDPSLFDIYVQLETQVQGVSYFTNNQILLSSL